MKKIIIKSLALFCAFMQITSSNVFANPLSQRPNVLVQKGIYIKPQCDLVYTELNDSSCYCSNYEYKLFPDKGTMAWIREKYSQALDVAEWVCLDKKLLKALTGSKYTDNSVPLLVLRAQERRISDPLIQICDDLGKSLPSVCYKLKNAIAIAKEILYIDKVEGVSYKDYMYCYFETILDVIGQLSNFGEYYWNLNLIRAEMGAAMACLLDEDDPKI